MLVVVATPDTKVVVIRDIEVGLSTTVAATATAVAAGVDAATQAGPMAATEIDPGTPTVASMVLALGVSLGD